MQWASSKNTSSTSQPTLWNGHRTLGSFCFDELSSRTQRTGERKWLLDVRVMLPNSSVDPKTVLSTPGPIFPTFLLDTSWQKGHGLGLLASALTGDCVKVWLAVGGGETVVALAPLVTDVTSALL